jgi:hypothetical protein
MIYFQNISNITQENILKFYKFIILFLVMMSLASCSNDSTGEFMQWHKVTLTFNGPESGEQAEVNPFLNYRLTVTFSKGTESFVVPGFYAADGVAANSGADSGNKWKCYFVPPSTGEWVWKVSFREGDTIALDDRADAGKPGYCDGETGSCIVVPSDKTAPDFRAKGTLQYTGGHYLQFAGSKDYYLKGGADSPENFLAFDEIDGTYDADAGSGSYSHIGGFIHKYEPHIKDWRTGDPSWQEGKGKGIIGALNYLAGKGMNSVYFLTYNLDGGDGRDVWMWSDVNERERFDCSKLDQWEIIFDHMDKLGIMLHVVTQEEENDGNLGGSIGMNPVRKLYYRELVARFSHHHAVIWNLGEENNTPDADRKVIAAYIRNLDPYNHPITFHTHVFQALTFYDGVLGDENFEATSIQGDMKNYHHETVALRQKSSAAGRKWAIFCDEQSEASHGVLPDADDPGHDIPRKMGLWGNLMGGGSGVEWYFGHQFPHMDINCEDWRSRDTMWDQTRYALEFFQSYLPFWDMEPADHLISSKDGHCLAKEGEIYALYLPYGGAAELDLGKFGSEFTVQWYSPRTGGDLVDGTVKTIQGPGTVSIGHPLTDDSMDWAVLVKLK